MDMHLHSNYSDGQSSLEEMTLAAIELGFDCIAFTDHVRRDSDWLPKYIDELRALKETHSDRIHILTGVEAKVTDLTGSIDFDEAYRKDIDYVLAAFHRIPLGNEQYIRRSEIGLDPAFALQKWLEGLKAVLANDLVDGIAHPFNLQSLFEPHWNAKIETEIKDLFVDSKKIVEYSVRYPANLRTDFWGSDGLKIVISSDSHSVSEIKENAAKIQHVLDSRQFKFFDVDTWFFSQKSN